MKVIVTGVIMSDNNLTLYFSSVNHIEIPVGSYCEYEGEIYTLHSPEDLTMHNTRNFEYVVVFESNQAKLRNYKFRELFNYGIIMVEAGGLNLVTQQNQLNIYKCW